MASAGAFVRDRVAKLERELEMAKTFLEHVPDNDLSEFQRHCLESARAALGRTDGPVTALKTALDEQGLQWRRKRQAYTCLLLPSMGGGGAPWTFLWFWDYENRILYKNLYLSPC